MWRVSDREELVARTGGMPQEWRGVLLVEQLLDKNYKVRIIVRSPHILPADIVGNPNTTTLEAGVLAFDIKILKITVW